MEAVARSLRSAADFLLKAAPYVVVELLLPGGTLVALLMFLRRQRGSTSPKPGTIAAAFEHTLGAVRVGLVPASGPSGTPRPVNDNDGLGPLAMAPGR
jgi:hypothetical protein